MMTGKPPTTPSTEAAVAAHPVKQTGDFDFLNGTFDVVNRRLKNPLTGSDEWEEFPATDRARTYFNGAISIDEMYFPTRELFGMSVRLFEPETGEWVVYWVNSRTGKLQPPVRGRWVDGISMLFGDDDLDGTPVLASYRWSDVTERTARWEQAFSTDEGLTWETNWQMAFTRRTGEPEAAPLPKLTGDFDFLVGRWNVSHRRLSTLLVGGDDWSEFSGTAVARTYFNGAVSIDEFDFPTVGSKGLTIRLFDPQARIWSIYWVSSSPGGPGQSPR